jgi:ATP:corrinoid adenosyltransferase
VTPQAQVEKYKETCVDIWKRQAAALSKKELPIVVYDKVCMMLCIYCAHIIYGH